MPLLEGLLDPQRWNAPNLLEFWLARQHGTPSTEWRKRLLKRFVFLLEDLETAGITHRDSFDPLKMNSAKLMWFWLARQNGDPSPGWELDLLDRFQLWLDDLKTAGIVR